MKTRYFNCLPMAIFLLIVFVFDILISVFCIKWFVEGKGVLSLIIGIILLLSSLFVIIYINYAFYFISFDSQKQTLTRRGLFFGFKHIINISDIHYVSKCCLYAPGGPWFYVIITSKANDFSFISIFNKKSSFKVSFTPKGRDFIKLFYKGELPKGKFNDEYRRRI